MLDNVPQSGKAAIMIKAAFLVSPKSREWCSAVHMRRRAVGLPRIHADLAGSVQVVPWISEERRYVAVRTFGLALSRHPFWGPHASVLGMCRSRLGSCKWSICDRAPPLFSTTLQDNWQ